MRKIVFDIETKNTFRDVGTSDPAALDLSVVCIYDYLEDKYECFFQEELNNLWKIIEKTDVIIGFNSDHFDLPLLNKYFPGDLFQIKSLDILKEIHSTLGRRIKLDVIAEATLGEKKSGHGLQAIKWWADGEYEKVAEYCRQDVKVTKEIYDHAIEHGKLFYKDLGKKREINIDASSWEKLNEDSALTHTLPF
jgi:DEAD/DEAH box helicase domain-containing protein